MSQRLRLAFGLLLGLALIAAPSARAEEPKVGHNAGEPPHAASAEGGGGGHGGAKAHGDPNILELQPPLAISTLIVFLILLAILWRFAWGPLSKALAAREQHQEELLQQAEHARHESERLLAAHRAQMDQAAEQIRAMLEQARRDADANADRIKQQAQAEAEAQRQQAKHDIATARDQALIEIWNNTANLAVSVAGKVLSKNLSADEQRRLVSSAISELPANPATGAGSGSHA